MNAPAASTLTETGVRERLTAVLAEILVLNPEDIHPHSLLVDDLDADSIAFLELTYRLKEDFGIETPNPKVDEATLTMPAPDALRKIEAMIGGTTLFEFMKDQALRAAVDDPAARRLLVDAVLRGGAGRDLSPLVRLGVRAAAVDPAARRIVRAVRDELVGRADTPSELVAELGDADAAFAGGVEAGGGAAGAGTPEARQFQEALLGEMDLAALARFMGGQVPPGMDPSTPFREIRLRDLFRFITVDSYVRYVLFLGSHAAPGAPVGAR